MEIKPYKRVKINAKKRRAPYPRRYIQNHKQREGKHEQS